MKTLAEVLEGLQQSIPKEAIHPADGSAGIFGEYITAQYAMQKANEIFDVDGVSGFEVLDDKAIEIPLPNYPFGNWVFITTVKVTFAVNDDGVNRQFSRPGRGVGTAFAPYNRDTGEMVPVKPQQLDTAAKSALSDAIKNALMRTGQALGAELYFDERMAQVLGWEIETDRVTRQQGPDGGGASEEDTLESLGAVVCKYGFGKADEDGVKPYTGWTIQQMWDDPDGRGMFQWAVDKEATGYFNERLRKFAALMDAQPEPDETEPEPGERMITIWTGESRPADDYPDWRKLSQNDGFVELLKKAFDPNGKIAGFGPNHKRMVNHYKYHFKIEDGVDLTWEMLNALVMRCKEGEQSVAFGYPQWYGEETEHVEDGAGGAMHPDEDAPSVHDTPEFVLGKGNKTQKVPTGLQIKTKEAEIEHPKAWLWDTVMQQTPVGEWQKAHTDLVLRILETIKEGKIEYDSPVVGQMWEFGSEGIAGE